MGDAGVTAHDNVRDRDEGEQVEQIGAAGEHGVLAQSGPGRDVCAEVPFVEGARDDDATTAGLCVTRHRRPPVRRPSTRWSGGTWMNDRGAGQPVSDRSLAAGHPEIAGIGGKPGIGHEPAPARDLVLVGVPRCAAGETVAREGDEPSGSRRQQQPMALGPAAVQVDGDVGTVEARR